MQSSGRNVVRETSFAIVVEVYSEVKGTHKPSAKANFICDFAETKYLRRSQRYEKSFGTIRIGLVKQLRRFGEADC